MSTDSDSDTSGRHPIRHPLLLADSSDEEDNASKSVARAPTGGSSIVHPSRAFSTGQNPTQSRLGFGTRSSSLSNRFNMDEMLPAPSPFSAPTKPGSTSAMSLVLPSKVYRGNGPFSTLASKSTAYTGSSANLSREQSSSLQSANIVFPSMPSEGNIFGSIVSVNNSAPQKTSAPPSDIFSQIRNHLPDEQDASNSDALVGGTSVYGPQREGRNAESQVASGSNIPASNPSFNGMATTEGATPSNQFVNGPQQPQDNLATIPSESNQNTNAPELHMPIPVSTTATNAMVAMAEFTPSSIHNFFSPGATANLSINSSSAPPSTTAQGTANANDESIPPAYRQEIDGSASGTMTEESSGDEYKDDGEDSDSSYTPRPKAKAAKKRKMKKDEERKRRKPSWRLESYPHPPASPHEPAFFTRPHKPLFKAGGSIRSEETSLQYFEYEEPKTRKKRKNADNSTRQDAGPSNAPISATNDHVHTETQNFEHGHNTFDTGYSFDVVTNVSAGTGDDNATQQVRTVTSNAQFSEVYGNVTGANPTGSGSATLQLLPHAQEQLVSIIIEDSRFADREPSFVEMILPLRPDGSGAYWLEATRFCEELQSGASRIDGPAKVYVFRNRFRQYFLRVSADNRDNYMRANLLVPADLVLKVMVEPQTVPTISPSTMDTASQPTPSRSSAEWTRIPSPAPEEARLPNTNGAPSRVVLHTKRKRDKLPVVALTGTSTSQPTTSGVSFSSSTSVPLSTASVASTNNEQETSTSASADGARRPYYRK